MGINDLLSFDEDAYAKKLEAIAVSGSMNEIREREVCKIRQIWGAGTKIGMGAFLALPTMGLTAISSLVGIRQLWVACAKLEAIKAVMKKHEITPHECSLRDAIIPITTNVLTASIGFGTSLGLSEVACMGAEQAAAQGVMPAPNVDITETLISAVEAPTVFGQGFMHGVETQVDGVLAALFEPGDAAANVAQTKIENAVPVGYCGGNTYINGASLGKTVAASMERFAVQLAITSFLESMAETRARDCLDRAIANQQPTEELRHSGEIYEWQHELDQVHGRLHEQYIDLSTVHSALEKASKGAVGCVATADLSQAMLEKTKTADTEAGRKRLDVESPPENWNVTGWFSALEEWQTSLKHQAHAEGEWQLIIDEWAATLRADDCEDGNRSESLEKNGSNDKPVPISPSKCELNEYDGVGFIQRHFFKKRDSEINLVKGQFVVIIGAKEDNACWLGCNEDGEQGFFPRSSVLELDTDTNTSMEASIRELIVRVGRRLASLDGRYVETLIRQYHVTAHIDCFSDADVKDRDLQATAELYHRPYEDLCRAISQTLDMDTLDLTVLTSPLLKLVRSLVNHSFTLATVGEDKLAEWKRTISSLETSVVSLSAPQDVSMPMISISKTSSLILMDKLFMHVEALATLDGHGAEEFMAIAPYLLTVLRTHSHFTEFASLSPCIEESADTYAALLTATSRTKLLRPNPMTHSAPTAVAFVTALGEMLMALRAFSISQSALISATGSCYKVLQKVWNLAKELELEAKRKVENDEDVAALSSTNLDRSLWRPAQPDSENQQLPPLPQRPQRQPTTRRRLPPAYEPPLSTLHPCKSPIHQHQTDPSNLSTESNNDSNNINTSLGVPGVDTTLSFPNRDTKPSMRAAGLKSMHQRLARQHAALATIKDDEAALEHMEYCIQLKAAAVAAWRSMGRTSADADIESKYESWDEALRMWESGIEVWDVEREAVCGEDF